MEHLVSPVYLFICVYALKCAFKQDAPTLFMLSGLAFLCWMST